MANLAPTENPLMAAGAKPKLQINTPAPAAAAPAGAGGAKAPASAAVANSNNCLIPGPPPDPPPNILKPPKAPPAPKGNIPVPAAPAAAAPEVVAAQVQDVPQEQNLDPIEAEKEKLLEDPVFAKFIKLYKMRVPMRNLLMQIKAGGQYSQDDIMLFATPGEVKKLKEDGIYTGTRF